ncbi:Ig-like domain-containing protein [Mycobacterium sp. CVI_P3]|uniref:Ig-like domain-containing protein n=1 Tax=Mycobacterium pinniadriaticum TaxID=2994102 RepID=A0ABT3SFQ1_9MYCO|nr:Ig-like domain-containing protein [Mycobacterium pinniadriaticum]MCX2931859.1 Ig-like domain-containing protein [Mycobacterium pinniadriaticum]MCX2938330.1 Ig-like domain-containing protein [Mycobacterium pinniadriaticum]
MRHKKPNRLQRYRWLGAGAIALGIGAALAGGSGVAHAEGKSDAGSAGPSARSSATGSSAARPGDRSVSTKPRRISTPRASLAGSARNPSSAGTARSARPSPRIPTPATPSAEVLATALAAATRREAGDVRIAAPAATTSVANAMAPANPVSELEREQAVTDINMSVGWVPGVGTLVNGLSLVADFLDFTIAALQGDFADMRDEIGDMTLDVIGMIPIVGAPLAATIHRAVAPVVTPSNHAPNAVNDSFATDENTQLTGNVLTNDTDADGDVLTAAVDTAPGHGALILNPDGSFTYTPAENFYGADGFSYTVTDDEGATAVGTATITVNYVPPPPVVDQQHPYSVDGTDPETGKISGHFNVTHDKPVTYRLDTPPDPALGTFELNEQTGEWTFTPNPRTRVLAGYFEPNFPAAVTLTFAVTATDGTASTTPIVVAENIAGSPSAALALPAGMSPVLSFLDPGTGDVYIFGYTGDAYNPGTEQEFSSITAVIHSDGSYNIRTDGDGAKGVAYGTFVVGDTAYLMTLTAGSDSSIQTHLSQVGPNGLTPVGDPIPGLAIINFDALEFLAPILAGETAYLVTTDYVSGSQTHLTEIAADGGTLTTSVPGAMHRDPIVVGDTTYVLTESSDDETGYETHVTALGPGGLTTTSVPGYTSHDPIVIGDTIYVLTTSGRYETGYETHVTALGPNAVTDTMSIPGSIESDPVVIGDTTYVLITPYSRIVTHVLALTPGGATPVGSIAGVLSGDPIVVGDTTYLLSRTGEDKATWRTWVTTLTPTLGGVTVVGDPVPGYLPGNSHQFVVGDTTYLVTQTWDSSSGDQTHLLALGPEGLTPIGDGIPGNNPVVIVAGDNIYLATTTSTYSDSEFHYQTHLAALTAGGLSPVPGSFPGSVNHDPIVVGDTTYLVTTTGTSDSGLHNQLIEVGPDGPAPVGGLIPGRVRADVILVGNTTYLVTETGDDESGYETHLMALGPDDVAPVTIVIPGRRDTYNNLAFPLIVVDDTTYLVTQTGELETVHTYFTAITPDGVTAPSAAIPGEARWSPDTFDAIIVVGETTYVLTNEWRSNGGDTYYPGQAHLTVLTPEGVTPLNDDLTPGDPWQIVIGDTTYLMMYSGDSESGGQVNITALTPDGPVPEADSFAGGSIRNIGDVVFVVGDTAYLTTTGGVWAIAVDGAGTQIL